MAFPQANKLSLLREKFLNPLAPGLYNSLGIFFNLKKRYDAAFWFMMSVAINKDIIISLLIMWNFRIFLKFIWPTNFGSMTSL